MMISISHPILYQIVCSDSPLDGCVSSQDDRPACFLAPWEYEGTVTKIFPDQKSLFER